MGPTIARNGRGRIVPGPGRAGAARVMMTHGQGQEAPCACARHEPPCSQHDVGLRSMHWLAKRRRPGEFASLVIRPTATQRSAEPANRSAPVARVERPGELRISRGAYGRAAWLSSGLLARWPYQPCISRGLIRARKVGHADAARKSWEWRSTDVDTEPGLTITWSQERSMPTTELEVAIRERFDANDLRAAATLAIEAYGGEVCGYLAAVLADDEQ